MMVKNLYFLYFLGMICLTSCGQSGPLYLPEPVPIKTEKIITSEDVTVRGPS